MRLSFEWDERKERLNRKNHEMGFDEAITVFSDPLSVTIYDPDHSLNDKGSSL